MNTLVIGFYGEGVTDNRFLPTLIQRMAEEIILKYSRTEIDVL